MTLRVRCSLLALVFVLVGSSGCGKKAPPAAAPAKGAPQANEAAQFYEALAAIQTQYKDARDNFVKSLNVSATGQLATLDTLQALQDKHAKALAKARADLKKVAVPNLKGAQQLYEANERYLQAEESSLKMFEKLMRAFHDMVAKPGTVDVAELGDNLSRAQKEYAKIEADLTQAQESFKKAHRL